MAEQKHRGPAGSVICALGAAATLLGQACAAPTSSASDELRKKSRPILGGTLSAREAVVLVRSQGPVTQGICSGTLVAPNLVLTARHCVSTFTDGDYVCTIDGDLDLSHPRSPANAGEMGAVYGAGDVVIRTGQVPEPDSVAAISTEILAPQTDTICRNDIAFVLLDRDIEIPPAPVRLDEGVFPQDEVTVVGYGTNDIKTTARFELTLPVLAVGPSDYFPQEGFAYPRTFVVGKSGCPGDSGGPALSDKQAALGVYSLVRGGCTSAEARNFYTQLSPFRELALEAFDKAGHEPIPEDAPPPPSDGSAGAGGSAAGGQNSEDEDSPAAGGCAVAPGLGKHFQGLWLLLLTAGSSLGRRRRCRVEQKF